MGVTTAIRAPTDDLKNHTIVLRQLKEVAELGRRVRGDPNNSFVTVAELTSAGIARFVNDQIQAPLSSSGNSTVSVADSITGNGSSASPLELVGDTASPGNSMLYGTNGSGTKGWYTQPSGSSSPLTTKGDVYVYSTANTRLPIGTDGTVLTADSTQPTGMAWDAVTSSGVWVNKISNTFASNTTGFASNGSGTWGIVGGALNQSTNSTNGCCFIYQTPFPGLGYRLQCSVELVSAGAGSAQVAGFCISNSGSPGTVPTGQVVDEAYRWVSGSPSYSSDFFGSTTIASFSFNWGSRDTFNQLEVIIIGTSRIAISNGTIIGSWQASGSYIGFQYFGVFSYGGAANFKNFTVDTFLI